MFKVHHYENGNVTARDGVFTPVEAAPPPFWIDLVEPTEEERRLICESTGLDVPTREEMVEIETSSRLYQENDTLFMTATLPYVGSKTVPETTAVTFVLNKTQLITVRYGNPRSIELFQQRLEKDPNCGKSPAQALLGMLDIIVDRVADLIEHAAGEIDRMSVSIFNDGISARKADGYKKAIKKIGRTGILVAKMHEVIATLTRLIFFLDQGASIAGLSKTHKSQLKTLSRDLRSIREHGDALDTKLNFLLDATVGLVNLEQNQIIKIFSVVAVVFMPPTLIASVYGMNFIDMPELKWALGYEFSIFLMVLSAMITWGFFRIKKLL